MSALEAAILTYHSLDETGSVISVSPPLFRRQMEALKAAGIPVAPLDQVREVPGSVSLTFDDGFCNFLEVAAPVLASLGFPATVFVVSGHCGGFNDWVWQPLPVPRLPLMGWSQVRQISEAGFDIGGHTVRHPRLTHLTPPQVAGELGDCRAEIEDHIGKPTHSFAYPYGDVSARVREEAGRVYRVCCSTELDFVPGDPDPLLLPRIDAYYLRPPWAFDWLCRRRLKPYLGLRRVLRRWRSALS